jgi:hypothetical protein
MKVEAFIDFYSDMSDEDPEYIHQYLVDEGIDVDGLRAKLLHLVAKKEAEIKLDKGRDFKTAYEKMKSKAEEILFNESRNESIPAPAVAYRKLNVTNKKDPDENANDVEKLKMIRRAKELERKSESTDSEEESSTQKDLHDGIE